MFIVCITQTTRGPFGTNLSYELEKESDEPFPLSMGLFDFQTICSYFSAGQLIEYLKSRELLHGNATTGDELNFAGYFLKFGHLNLRKGEFLTDDFSSFFDRKWYREKGINVEEPPDQPASMSMTRKGNRVFFEYGNGQKDVVRLPPWVIERTIGKSPITMKGSTRNKPCPCFEAKALLRSQLNCLVRNQTALSPAGGPLKPAVGLNGAVQSFVKKSDN